MTTLDTRARHAAAAIHHSVAEFTPTVTVGGVVRRSSWHRALNFAGAAAVVVLAIVLGAFLRAATDTEDVADTIPPEPMTTTTIIELEEPVVETELPDIIVPTDPEAAPVTPLPVPDSDPGAGGQEPLAPPPIEEEPPAEEADTEPPFLEITSPENGAVSEDEVIRFEGRTEPGAAVTSGPYEATVDADGGWSITLVLSAGGNGATFTARDAAGNESTARITVHYEPPEKPEPPPEVGFTAFSTFGSCSEDPPYDVYYGTAGPEAKVTVTSEYGSGVVFADGKGDWEVKVFFPEAPYGKTFLVTVKDDKGHSKKFEMVSLVGA